MDGKIFTALKGLTLFWLVSILCSCSDNANNTPAFKTLNESLVNSNETIDCSTEAITWTANRISFLIQPLYKKQICGILRHIE